MQDKRDEVKESFTLSYTCEGPEATEGTFQLDWNGECEGRAASRASGIPLRSLGFTPGGRGAMGKTPREKEWAIRSAARRGRRARQAWGQDRRRGLPRDGWCGHPGERQ